MRIFLTISSINNWTVKTTGLTEYTSNLQERESDAEKGTIWKLKHGPYGLKDGARQFYLSVKDELLRLGCKMRELDSAMFFLL